MSSALRVCAWVVAAWVACAWSVVTPLAAQTISGIVLSESGRRTLPGASVTVLGADGRQLGVTTDDEGRFRARLSSAGTYRLRVRQIGHADFTTDPLEVASDVVVDVEILLGIDAVPLAPLRVVTRRTIPEGRLRPFYERMENPAIGGFFVTRDEIERRPMATPTTLVVGAPGVSVIENGMLGQSVIVMGECLARVFVDGVRINSTRSVDDFLHPDAIGGVEVYTSRLETPPQYLDATPHSCGAVLFWTRDVEPSDRGWGLKRILVGVGLIGALAVIGLGG